MSEPWFAHDFRPTIRERVCSWMRRKRWKLAIWRGVAPSNDELNAMQQAGELQGKWSNPKHAKRINLHWCCDWDGLLIDKYSGEVDFCTCQDGPDTWTCPHGLHDSDNCPDCRH